MRPNNLDPVLILKVWKTPESYLRLDKRADGSSSEVFTKQRLKFVLLCSVLELKNV